MRTEIGAGGITGDGGEKERIPGNYGDYDPISHIF
jgi:hypothetical protein